MFVDGPINIAWGANRAASDVQEVPKAWQTPRFKARVLAGVIVETKDPVTGQPDSSDTREYKLMTGKEAAEHMKIPAGPVTRTMWDPVVGDTVQVEMGSPKVLDEALREAERADAEARGEGEDDGDIDSVTEVDGDRDDDDEGTPPATIDVDEGPSGDDQGSAANPAVAEHPGAVADAESTTLTSDAPDTETVTAEGTDKPSLEELAKTAGKAPTPAPKAAAKTTAKPKAKAK
jgi:hypothetical protein